MHGTWRHWFLQVYPWALLFAKDFFDKKDLAQTSPGPGPKIHAEWISKDDRGSRGRTQAQGV